MTYKKFAISLARQAGKIMLRNFRLGMEKEWKENNTPVTKTDIAVNRLVINSVKKYFPGHDVLGEEESHRSNKGEFLWVCDPVDGTIPFSHGIPIFTFSLALVKNGTPVAGVVYDPFMDRLFFAEFGKGAFLNGRKINVNKRGLKNSAISWESLSASPNLRKLTGALPFTFLSYVYGAVLVACGELSAAFYSWYHAHDAAAVKIIVEEAGGKVTDMRGKDQRYDREINGCLASNGLVHARLLSIVKKHYKGR